MDKNQIFEILNDWNLWKKDLATGVEREAYLRTASSFLESNVVLAIIGVRRSGKSCLMRQLAKDLVARGVGKDCILIVNLEDGRLTGAGLLDEIYEGYLELMHPSSRPFIFLDEVGKVDGWERWVRTLHELGKAKLIISGSSAGLLSGDLATLLTGRHLDIRTFPLSFWEFLLFRGIEVRGLLDIVDKKVAIRSALNEYMEFGGFPEVVLGGNKLALLQMYSEDIITKDIEKRYEVREGGKLRTLAGFYLANISSPVTFNSLKGTLGMNVGTVERFSSYLEEANLVFFIRRFSFKVGDQERSPKKVYSIDHGLANAVGFRFSANTGKVAENIVAVELKRMCAEDPGLQVYYWKNPQHEEVDFVVKEGLEVKRLVQVCWDIEDRQARKRELRALLKAGDDLRCSDLLVVTGEKDGEEVIDGRKIVYRPLWRWLLERGVSTPPAGPA
jgi:predicted AAA+ superfamily ATPase